jgi:hypothetical protein
VDACRLQLNVTGKHKSKDRSFSAELLKCVDLVSDWVVHPRTWTNIWLARGIRWFVRAATFN